MTFMISIVALLGLSIGSFLNVCTYRIPRRISVVTPGSFCPECRHALGWLELIPIVSYIFLKGKCRHCSQNISSRYPVVELLTGVIFVVAFMEFGLSLRALVTILFLSLMLMIGIIDWVHLLIPNIVVLAGIACGIVLRLLGGPQQILDALGGACLAAGSLAAIRLAGFALFRKEVMGRGDVKLAFVIGLYLGIGHFLLAIWIAAVAGVLFAAARFIMPSDRPRSVKIPFGTFLASASSIIFVFSETISRLWLSLLNL